MKVKSLCLFVVLIFVVSFSFIGCGSSSDDDDNETPLTSATYSGADPKGDFIAITVDGDAKTVTYNNYTTDEVAGPFAYSKVTDSSLNGGFSNMYMTEVFDTSLYALFVIVDGVAIIFQLFDNNGTAANYDDDTADGTPGYAFVRKDMANLLGYKGTAFNWISFKMETDGTESNFEAGFAAFDTNNAPHEGLLYGACYNNRADNADGLGDYIDYDANGIKGINDTGWGLGDFAYVPADMSHYYAAEDLTFIPNENDDCVLDFGAGEGAGFAIQQASTGDWQTAYNGTYLMMVYSNDDTDGEQEVNPMKLVLSSSATAGQGYFKVYEYGESTVEAESDLVPLEDLAGGASPGGATPLKDQFATASNCGVATSAVVQEANNAHGGFVAQWGDSILFMMMDPSGNYMFFTMFTEDVGGYDYAFGFGVKD